MLSKLMLMFTVVLLPVVATAQDVDGIWENPTGPGFVSIHSNTDSIIFVFLDQVDQADPTSWEAYVGGFNGTTSDLRLALPEVGELVAQLTFLNTTTATFEVVSCVATVANFNCNFEPGTKLFMQKLY